MSPKWDDRKIDVLTAAPAIPAGAPKIFAEHPWSLLAAIVDSTDDAIVSKDLNGIVTSWNQAAVRMFGYQPEEMIGQPILRIIPPELHYQETEILRKMRAGERIDHFETTRVAKDGTYLEVSLTISPVKDPDGRVIGTSKIARDISNRRKMEGLILQSEKIAATGRMAATIAHEINNPLEAVLNLVYLARESSAEESDAYRYLATAENELERVSHIARSTLGYYRDRSTPTEMILDNLLDGVLAIFTSKLTARRIVVERNYEKTRPIVLSKGEMMQVFSNIFSNSIDAMPNGGTIRVHVGETAGDCVQVSVEDQGTGIKEEHLSRIFEPFFTTKPDVGTGIGLWVTKRLIEGCGGRIEVTSSTKPGESGTKMLVEIPY